MCDPLLHVMFVVWVAQSFIFYSEID